ncbi:MAG: ARMT1-like domain-containing protein [Methanosphaera sp.]|nr:ARMT1-like domain-containing protein [Methanosphaera sp.]
MKVKYECASCMLRQSREAIENSVEDFDKRMAITLEVLDFMHENFKKDTNSNKLGTDLHRMIMELTGNDDPYKLYREEGNTLAKRLIPSVTRIIDMNPTLESYVKIAVCGNIIDFGALKQDTDMEKLIREKINEKLIINDVDKLDEDLKKANKILYLADNGGEIVFDKLLIEKIKEDYDLEIILALKKSPILNDAIVSDAYDLGLDEYATIISTGTNSVGVVKDYISDELTDLLDNVDLVISKGMGNFEGLTEMDIKTTIYYLLNSKCNVISSQIGVDLGSIICYRM